MNSASRRIAGRLSVAVALLMALSSGAGLFAHDLYRDSALVAASWYGNDLVTFVVATPLLGIALLGTWGGSRRALLVWMGLLAYSLYNSALYLFGAAFNSLFLVYAALCALSGAALIFGLLSIDARALHRQVQPDLPTPWISGFMMLVAVALGGVHAALALRYVATGRVPATLDAIGLHTDLIAALDLTMVVPVALLAGAWLWRGRPWGYVWATLWCVKGAACMLSLSAATVASVVVGPSSGGMQLLLWGPIGVGCVLAGGVLLRALRPGSRTR
ncbi:hypothetical protein [Salinibacter sp.]|uniref:hypothetical protein n=1 Tax=Salinibacter sp. TaxID=2065818 RepID=UPI0021E92377|nr:hypothetical protein [Salinibacter sp.]